MQDALPAAEEAIRFDAFSLYPARQLLLRDGVAVRLGERPFRLLCLLVERAGGFVASEEILRRLWPHALVSEGNLRVHVATLRKALGDGREGRRYIVNAHNRGYSFVAPLRSARAGPPPGAGAATVAAARGLPAPPAVRLFGRQSDLEQAVRKLSHRRLLTLVGPGGVGKTALAVAAARRLLALEAPGLSVCHLDLSAIAGPGAALPALRIALGLEAFGPDAVAGLLARLQAQPVLLVLDGCDPALAEVAATVEQLIAADCRVRVLATSREPLCVDGECLQFVDPLDAGGPAFDAGSEPAALALFRARLDAAGGARDAGPAGERAAWQICRLLDGLPFGIERAAEQAARAGRLATQRRLLRELGLWNGPRREAPGAPTLGWQGPVDQSLARLSAVERRVCRRLAGFDGRFSLADAEALASPDLPAPAVLEALMSLVDKSLVRAHADGDEPMFHLLNTTRSCALRLPPDETRGVRQPDARPRRGALAPEPCAA